MGGDSRLVSVCLLTVCLLVGCGAGSASMLRTEHVQSSYSSSYGYPPLMSGVEGNANDMEDRVERLEGEVEDLKSQLASAVEAIHILTARVDSLSPVPPENCTLTCEHGGKPDRMCTQCVGCDSPWTGVRCDECGLACHHDGVANSDCTACDSCAPGWKGDLCEDWDVGVPVDQLVSYLHVYSNDSLSELSKLSPLPGVVGTGIDIATRSLRLPVVSLTYSPDGRTWTSSKGKTYMVPNEVEFELTPGQFSPQVETFTFTSIESYSNWRASQLATREGRGGFFQADPPSPLDVFRKYFKEGNRFLMVNQELHPIYELSLPFSPSHVRDIQLDKFAQKAIDYLPADLSVSGAKDMYTEFLHLWGTHFTSSSSLGGVAELSVRVQNCLSNSMSTDQLSAQGRLDLDAATGEGEARKMDELYVKMRTSSSIAQFGGVPDSPTYAEWRESILSNPVELQYKFSEISQLIRDPVKRRNMQQIVAQQLEEYGTKIDSEIQQIGTEQDQIFLSQLPIGVSVRWEVVDPGEMRIGDPLIPSATRVGNLQVQSTQNAPFAVSDAMFPASGGASFKMPAIATFRCDRDASGDLTAVLGPGSGDIRHGTWGLQAVSEEVKGNPSRGGCASVEAVRPVIWYDHGHTHRAWNVRVWVQCCFDCSMEIPSGSQRAQCMTPCDK